MATLWIASLFVLAAACDDDDDDDDKGYKPAKSVQVAFEAKFPNATSVSWEKKGDYEKAEFKEAGQDCDAWYTATGTWMMTEKDMLFMSLPEDVKTGFSNSIYSTWKIGDVEMLDRLNMPLVYSVDIENGTQKMVVYFNAAGELVKEVTETVDNLPTDVSNYLTLKYPKALIVEKERWQNGVLEVDMIDDSRVKEALFARDNAWIQTSWPVLRANVPEVVLDVLKGAAYTGHTVGSIHYIQNASGTDVYQFVLKKDNTENMTVNIDPRGNVVLD